LRRPLGWLFLTLEQTDLLAAADGIFLFGDNKIGIFPTAFFDFGFAPSFGIYFFWTDFLFEGNRISMNGGTFGPRWLNGAIKDQITFNENTHLTARLKGFRRPDQIFGDIGGDARLITSRYGTSQIDTSLIFDSHFWRRSRVEAEFGYRSASFEDGRALGDPSISEEMISRGQPLPDGFVSGYSAFRLGLDLRLDTREVTVRPNAGVSLRLLGEAHVAAVAEDGLDGWLRWGGLLRASTDILGDDRILSLGAALAFITPVGEGIVPFTELIDIGALGSINGFLPGLVRGRSLAAMVASYEWPIWVFLNGRMHFGVGNVFDEHLAGFDAEDLRMSFGVGFEPTIDGESNFELAVAFGTDTFRNGPGVQSFRFVIGVNNDL
ncbi:MAG: BamA/TamA family outer membrane protein, partial [Deltaproteobacteria bacterium]|nr:BamA/TamA family outer membrane protein [Deltaproteobacteria bacterium]